MFAQLDINSSSLGNALSELLTAPDIQPGDQPSYQTCKTVWLFHPLGKKMVEAPVEMAQSQEREISIPDSPEDRVRDQFVKEWRALEADQRIANVMATARAYGIASIALLTRDTPPNEPVNWKKLADSEISFSVLDPLNTAGSLVLNQDPNSLDFQKITGIAVSGTAYHRSRTVTMMHERPVYIAFTTSAFGFVGRSVFQRALFPLKSYVQTLITDDLVVKKAGVFIAMLKAGGAIIDSIMQSVAGLKRLFVKQSTNGNVISIGVEEKIETLNMQNIDGAYGQARTNILDNIAISCDMPAIILKEEVFVEGFGEGTEDAKKVARWVDRERRKMDPLYQFFDRVVQHRAWNREFYAIIQKDFPEWADVAYEEAFYRWTTSFAAAWPSLLTEPDSEKVKTDDVKLKAIIATIEVFGPMLDPENKATLLMWAQDNLNENKMMFQSPLELDYEALATYEPPEQQIEEEPSAPKPFADAAAKRMRRLDDGELKELVDVMGQGPENLPPTNGANGHARPGPRRDRAAYMRDYRARQRNGHDTVA